MTFERSHLEPHTPPYTDSLYQEIKHLEGRIVTLGQEKALLTAELVRLRVAKHKEWSRADEAWARVAELEKEVTDLRNASDPETLGLIKQLANRLTVLADKEDWDEH